MNDQEILSSINKIIISENGLPVQMSNLFIQSDLDSLGVLIVILDIAGEYNISGEVLDELDFSTLTVINLVNLCKSSITNT